jgi:hypothetical protein
MSRTTDYQGCQPNKILVFLKLSYFWQNLFFFKFKEYVLKRERIRIYEIVKNDSRRNSHKRSHSTKPSFMQNLVKAYVFIFIH